ncbi:hypothetical protein LTR36_003639 [Oleoguttula mirabilis]|uniref:Uncharacterized protein n=1 Tax=Oleoguttula mirabilis TaxID=1507867 RepID=A0AAV9JJ07_9PEZI|nr:hypothetical protein LTR36_003639 [Oleoguttula mirabilis]
MAEQLTPTEPVFRANKRRKTFRRRDDEADEEHATNEHSAQKDILATAGDTNLPSLPISAVQVNQRPAARKYGIAFNSTNRPQAQEQGRSEEMAIIPVLPSRDQDVAPIERFVKPTGKAAVVDDRHMLAFVDTKLAEMRSASSARLAPLSNETIEDRTNQALNPKDTTFEAKPAHARDAAVSSAASRVNKQRNARPRRPPPMRDAGNATRDSLVDQIMKESAVPLYDRSTSATPYHANGANNDAAVMEAFKADFLAEMEEHKKRKPPAPPAGTKGVVATSNGPKLGGSRSQREKMKAMEANKAGTKK